MKQPGENSDHEDVRAILCAVLPGSPLAGAESGLSGAAGYARQEMFAVVANR
jgi:hypothetical protein